MLMIAISADGNGAMFEATHADEHDDERQAAFQRAGTEQRRIAAQPSERHALAEIEQHDGRGEVQRVPYSVGSGKGQVRTRNR